MTNCTIQPFGRLPNGEGIDKITLENDLGWKLVVLTLGGTISELHVGDASGQLRDVVLGFDELEPYLETKGRPYFGCITGRVAGRTSGGRFKIGEQDFALVINNGPNHLHGGIKGLDQRVWKAKTHNSDAGPVVELSYHSPSGEEGYPGSVDLVVTYTLSHAGALEIDYNATVDQTTPLCLTNHSYFNFSSQATINDHILAIHSDKFIPSDQDLTLTDRIEQVNDVNDFTKPRTVGPAIPKLHMNHGDHYFFGPKSLNHDPLQPSQTRSRASPWRPSAPKDTSSFTVAIFLVTSKANQEHPTSAMLAFVECQGYPNGVNHPEIEDILVHPRTPYHQKTIYQFSCQQSS